MVENLLKIINETNKTFLKLNIQNQFFLSTFNHHQFIKTVTVYGVGVILVDSITSSLSMFFLMHFKPHLFSCENIIHCKPIIRCLLFCQFFFFRFFQLLHTCKSEVSLASDVNIFFYLIHSSYCSFFLAPIKFISSSK